MKNYHDIETEHLFIGCLINNPEAIGIYNDLANYDFAEGAYYEIYDIIKNQYEKGVDVNDRYLINFFEDNSDMQKLILKASSAAIGTRASSFYGLIKHLSAKRKIQELLNEALQELEIKDPDEIIEKFYNISEINNSIKIKTTQELYAENYELYKSNFPKYSTGISALDNSMGGGLYQGKFYCIAARQKVGKTIALATIAHNLGLQGTPVMFFACEMFSREITQRLLSYDTGLNSVNFFKEKKNSVEKKYADAVVKLNSKGLWVDSAGLTVEKIESICKRYATKYKIKGIIIDYLQIMGGKGRSENEAEFQARIAQKLAEIAKKLNIFILTAAQLNREGELRGSDGIRNAVDQLYYLHRPDKNSSDRYMTLEASRYTMSADIGSKENPTLTIDGHGPVLKQKEV